MELHPGRDVVQRGSGSLYRQMRLRGTLGNLFFAAVFAAFPIVAWQFGGGYAQLVTVPIAIVGGLLALVTVPALLRDSRLRYGATNWVMWIRGESIWVNLRSYQDQNLNGSASALQLSPGEVAEARRFEERYAVPDASGRRVQYKLASLELDLRQDASRVAEAIAAIRRQQQPQSDFLGGKVRSNVTLHSVSLAAPRVLRIAWYGGRGHAISPRLSRVLDELSSLGIKIGEPLSSETDWLRLSDDEIDNRILSLVEAGNAIDAARILVRRRGMSLVEAKRFVEELRGRA